MENVKNFSISIMSCYFSSAIFQRTRVPISNMENIKNFSISIMNCYFSLAIFQRTRVPETRVTWQSSQTRTKFTTK